MKSEIITKLLEKHVAQFDKLSVSDFEHVGAKGGSRLLTTHMSGAMRHIGACLYDHETIEQTENRIIEFVMQADRLRQLKNDLFLIGVGDYVEYDD